MKNVLLIMMFLFTVSLFAVDNFAGNCLDFDGVDDFVSVVDDNSLDLNTFTVSFWLKPDGTGGQYIINKGENAVQGVGYRIYLDSTTLWADTYVPTRVYSSGTVTIGAWQHVAFTYDGTIQKLYVNGNLVDSDAQSGTLETNDDPLLLACRLFNSNESDFYEGELDEVRIWNIARTQTEINDDMNHTLSGAETGLVSYWQLNESSGTTASDAVGSNEGVLYNMANEDWVTSTAPVGFPTLSTTIAGSITQNSAESGGNVIWEGESNVTVRGVCWSTDPNPTTADDYTTDGTGMGVFTSNITGLNSGISYYYRAYATNSLGICYGEEYTFITTPLFSGSGTEADPYQISNLDELRFLSEHSAFWNSYFIQTADIDATATSGWNSGEGFSPIGESYLIPFTGEYDGAGFTIDGLFINRPSSDTIGLFGYIESADISDLGVINVNITGNDYVGALVGDNSDSSSVNSSYSTGSVSGNEAVGGLVGDCYYSSINDSYSACTVNGFENTGGLAGEITESAISVCYNTGGVIGGNSTGGLIGSIEDFSTIDNSYSTGSVSGNDFVGGLAGNNFQSISITNCFSTGNVTGNEIIAGLLGYISSGCSITNCFSAGSVSGNADLGGLVSTNYGSITASFWDTETSGLSYSAGGTGKTTTEMKTQTTFTDAGWDFIVETTNGTEDNWVMNGFDNSGYPFFTGNNLAPVLMTTIASSITDHTASSGGEILDSGQSAITSRGVCWSTDPNPTTADVHTTDGTGTGVFTSNITGLISLTTYYYKAYAINSMGIGYGPEQSFTTLLTGSGTETDPYQISKLNELRFLSEHSDYWNSYFIQIADIDATDTQNWNSGEGFSPIGVDFDNHFSGNYNGQGYIINSLYINRSSISYQGLFGYIGSADISDLGIINANITGLNWVGALVGSTYEDNTITNCYSSGSVTGIGNKIGGLVGYVYTSTITNIYSTAIVIGNNQVGSLVGETRYSSITNSYSIGNVTGNDLVGGLVGFNDYSTVSNSYSTGSVTGTTDVGGLVGNNYYNSPITNSYSTGSVTGTTDVGGLVGNNYSTVTNSFWDIQTSGQYNSAGGIGKTTADMQTKTTFTDVGWDFTGETTNGSADIWSMDYYGIGYPYLGWQDTAPAGSVPRSPENIQISMDDRNALISWDEVNKSTDGYSIVVDGYILLNSVNNLDFNFYLLTTETNFNHGYVASFNSKMFYQVTAIKNYSKEQLDYLQELNNSKEKLRWSEVKKELDRIK